jgi:hypothetical protein
MVLESSLAVVMKDAAGKMLGVSATDVALDQLQKRFGAIHPFDTGYVRMVSEGGLYVVSAKPELLGKPVPKEDALASHLEQIKKGEDFIFEDGGFTHFFHPVKVGDTGQFWTLGFPSPRQPLLPMPKTIADGHPDRRGGAGGDPAGTDGRGTHADPTAQQAGRHHGPTGLRPWRPDCTHADCQPR